MWAMSTFRDRFVSYQMVVKKERGRKAFCCGIDENVVVSFYLRQFSKFNFNLARLILFRLNPSGRISRNVLRYKIH